MWCRSCQQDVPAVASLDDSAVRCARCHADLSLSRQAADAGDSQATTRKPAEDSPKEADDSNWSTDAALRSWESWEFAEDLRAADRMVNSLGIRRVDAAHEVRTEVPLQANESRTQPTIQVGGVPATRSVPQPRRGSFLTWTIMSIGLMTFAFGTVLLAWSFWMGRADLWRLGMPFTLAGQAVMVIGLVFQLDGLWRSNQAATESLDELDEQLGELRQATALLSTSHSGPSQSFYSHLASGAGPQLLLADLKGQLDLLAIKLGQEKR